MNVFYRSFSRSNKESVMKLLNKKLKAQDHLQNLTNDLKLNSKLF